MLNAISIVIFANLFALMFMWFCGSQKNCTSRTETELRILEEEDKK